MIAFVLLHLLALLMLAAAAWGAGSIAGARLDCPSIAGLVAIRSAVGLATLGLVFFTLGLAGLLTATASALVAAAAVAAGALRIRDLRALRGLPRVEATIFAIALLPVFVLSLYPPVAFDETLYHLPTIERFAATGRLEFIDYLRVPVFPHLDEVLRVPLFQLGGDVATHLLALFATLVTALLLLGWFIERSEGGASAGWLAAALFLSAPLVVQLATTGYVEALLTMFVAAAFYAFDRWRSSDATAWLVAAGVFAGCAASVKYLGLFWVGALFLLVLSRSGARARNGVVFAITAVLVLAPWYGRIVYFTGNPLFPFASGIFGHTVWDGRGEEPRTVLERLIALLRLPWDGLFARERTGSQPPFSPFLVALIPVVVIRAFRDRLILAIASVVAVWCAVWVWLPHDARYLEPAIALLSAAAALAVVSLLSLVRLDSRRALGIVAIAVLLPGPLYALYRIDRNGAIPFDRPSRDAFLAKQVPEYGAIAFLNTHSRREDVAWFCGGEQFAYHFRGLAFGDLTGAARFELISSARDESELNRRAARLGAHYIVVDRKRCEVPVLARGTANRSFSVVYQDSTTAVYERRSP
ncbi:MAG: phospholipid carrier-dependent glycosyltransferase [Thermoanaerobaculia bacterium]|jgi:hypothetical protein